MITNFYQGDGRREEGAGGPNKPRGNKDVSRGQKAVWEKLSSDKAREKFY